MDQEILVTEETEAGKSLVGELSKTLPVQAAFWLKESDGSSWYLHIASDAVDDRNLWERYGQVLDAASQSPTPQLDPFRVKLIPAGSPLAQAAIELNRRYPGRMATRLGGAVFGGIGVDGVYVYPNSAWQSPAPSPAS